MPIANSSSPSSSANLNVNAVEFIPTTSFKEMEVPSQNQAGESANKKTGAIPKNNRRPNRQASYYADNRRNQEHRNWRNGPQKSNREEEEENKEEQQQHTDRKFFKNNYPQQQQQQQQHTKIGNHRKPNNQRRSSKRVPDKEISISQREQLIKDIETNSLECMICCEKIKAYASTFNCTNCHHILHLNCIKTWIKNSKNEQGEWRCPACNQISKHQPNEYLCFCTKVKNPTPNRNDLAHSCGNMCLNTSNCIHPCTAKCHPGPHEICHASVNCFCGCGKESKPYQCHSKASFECEGICEKLLNCGIHRCAAKCHQGRCEDCKHMIECACFCGNERKEIPCIEENINKTDYACDKECERILACGNHKCSQKCHKEVCKECVLLPKFIKSCPCGKKPIKEDERKSCLDPILTCTDKCTKPLKCGPLSNPHKCLAICHTENCPPCTQTSKVRCRCGRKEETIPCKDLTNSDIRCKKKCTKYKNCSKHKCNIECCIEFDHACNQNCNKILNCKIHRCQRSCHLGNCSPCHRVSFDELRCECGLSVIYPPVPCGTPIKECLNTCKRSHNCNHPVNHNCHSETNCPPCVFLTKKFCYGKHKSLNTIPCNQESFSCGLPCKKPLKCGRHFCIKKCHQGVCEKLTEECSQKCIIKRECLHNCNLPCHEEKCPDTACKEKVEVTCLCGNLKASKTCEQVEYENRKLQRVQMSMQGDDGDNAMNLKDLMGDLKKTTKILECNNDCKTLERNRRMEIGFKLINPTLSTLPKFVPNYSQHVRTFYKKESAFIMMIHEKLTDLVKLAKDSKAPYRSFSFPSMNRDKRHAVHDMAEQFGVETKAYDAEPNRNVVATAMRESCWLPSMSISEVIQREKGLRRPPTSL